jgi:hypothetical protein
VGRVSKNEPMDNSEIITLKLIKMSYHCNIQAGMLAGISKQNSFADCLKNKTFLMFCIYICPTGQNLQCTFLDTARVNS